MPRLKSPVVAILSTFVSLGLFVAGWGAGFANAVGAVGVALGGVPYVRSLYIALRDVDSQLVAGPGGMVHAAWSDSRDGVSLQLWSQAIAW